MFELVNGEQVAPPFCRYWVANRHYSQCKSTNPAELPLSSCLYKSNFNSPCAKRNSPQTECRAHLKTVREQPTVKSITVLREKLPVFSLRSGARLGCPCH